MATEAATIPAEIVREMQDLAGRIARDPAAGRVNRWLDALGLELVITIAPKPARLPLHALWA